MASDGKFKRDWDNLGPQRSVISPTRRQTVIELSGVIKWFDVSKGFGFIVPDNGCRTSCCT